MKCIKTSSLFLTTLFLLFLLAGCGNSTAQVPISEPASEPAVVKELPDEAAAAEVTSEVAEEGSPANVITTVDEFIAAIAPNAELFLSPGVFSLPDASTYGDLDSGNEYCYWNDSYDGFELVIQNVDGLTIHGSGLEDTNLITTPRYANVLRFVDCSSITITDLTAGHTIAEDSCIADVLNFSSTNKITIQRCGLFGCGSSGISTDFCNKLDVQDCDIYHCTAYGLWLMDTRNVTVTNTKIHDLGNDSGGTAIAAVGLHNSQNVSFEHCNFQANKVWYLFSARSSTGIVWSNSGAADNQVEDYAFSLYQSDFVLDNTEITGNYIPSWYAPESTYVVDPAYNPMDADALTRMYVASDFDDGEYGEVELREVHVTTVDEFVHAIAPNTCIYLDAAEFDLSKYSGYGGAGGMYYEWHQEFDGPSLWITDVPNLTIMSTDGNKNAHTISAVPRYADVLAFSNCSNLCLIGFTAGHTTEPGYCSGGVLRFENCDNIFVCNNNLYGCGVLGIQTDHCTNLVVSNCNIYECSYGGMELYSTRDVEISGCSFWSLGGPKYFFSNCVNVMVDGEEKGSGSFN